MPWFLMGISCIYWYDDFVVWRYNNNNTCFVRFYFKLWTKWMHGANTITQVTFNRTQKRAFCQLNTTYFFFVTSLNKYPGESEWQLVHMAHMTSVLTSASHNIEILNLQFFLKNGSLYLIYGAFSPGPSWCRLCSPRNHHAMDSPECEEGLPHLISGCF